MKRSELLKSREYWIADVQLKLFDLIENYRKTHHLTKTQIAEKLGFTKGYITQVLNGDFDHKLSKLVDLSLSFSKVPVINFVEINDYLNSDTNNKVYELISVVRPQNVTFETKTISVPENPIHRIPPAATIRTPTLTAQAT